MNHEQAQSYIGKTVYTVDYGDSNIIEHLVESISGSTYQNSDVYTLIGEDSPNIFNPKETWDIAHQSLLQYYETRVQVAMDNLNSVHRLKEQRDLVEES